MLNPSPARWQAEGPALPASQDGEERQSCKRPGLPAWEGEVILAKLLAASPADGSNSRVLAKESKELLRVANWL